MSAVDFPGSSRGRHRYGRVAGREIAGDGGIELTILGGPAAEEMRDQGVWEIRARTNGDAATAATPHIGVAAVRPDALAGPTPPRIGSFRTCRALANRRYHTRAPRNRPRLWGYWPGGTGSPSTARPVFI
jgi:hypothetical protein